MAVGEAVSVAVEDALALLPALRGGVGVAVGEALSVAVDDVLGLAPAVSVAVGL